MVIDVTLAALKATACEDAQDAGPIKKTRESLQEAGKYVALTIETQTVLTDH